VAHEIRIHWLDRGGNRPALRCRDDEEVVMTIGRAVASALALGVAAANTMAPEAAQDFYKGKTLTIVVGFTAGGGFDLNARLLARHLGRHLAGNPDVIVQNMPGAASLKSVLYLDTTAPRDGTGRDDAGVGLPFSNLPPQGPGLFNLPARSAL
jgi:hypothetical protein